MQKVRSLSNTNKKAKHQIHHFRQTEDCHVSKPDGFCKLDVQKDKLVLANHAMSSSIPCYDDQLSTVPSTVTTKQLVVNSAWSNKRSSNRVL